MSAAFDMQPTLIGPTVTLSPTVEADWAGQWVVAQDRELWAGHPASDRWQEPVFRAYFDDNLSSGGALTIRDNESGAVIGHSRFDMRKVEPGEVEIGGTFLAREYWGGTTNREIKTLMIAHGLASFERVVFYIGEDNLRSRRAMEKIGGRQLEGRIERFAMAGVVRDHLVYAIESPLV